MRRRRPRVAPEAPAPVGRSAGIRSDAVSALVNLGYAEDVATRAVAAALTRADGKSGAGSLEEVLRNALGELVR